VVLGATPVVSNVIPVSMVGVVEGGLGGTVSGVVILRLVVDGVSGVVVSSGVDVASVEGPGRVDV
jgi:hypothetical protein